MKKLLLIFTLILLAVPAFADGDDDDEHSGAFIFPTFFKAQQEVDVNGVLHIAEYSGFGVHWVYGAALGEEGAYPYFFDGSFTYGNLDQVSDPSGEIQAEGESLFEFSGAAGIGSWPLGVKAGVRISNLAIETRHGEAEETTVAPYISAMTPLFRLAALDFQAGQGWWQVGFIVFFGYHL